MHVHARRPCKSRASLVKLCLLCWGCIVARRCLAMIVCPSKDPSFKNEESAWFSLFWNLHYRCAHASFSFCANEEKLSFQSGPSRGLTLTTYTTRRVSVPHYLKLGSSVNFWPFGRSILRAVSAVYAVRRCFKASLHPNDLRGNSVPIPSLRLPGYWKLRKNKCFGSYHCCSILAHLLLFAE